MAAAARLHDRISGTTAGEHSGHIIAVHGPEVFEGEISGGCSDTVCINGIAAATAGSTTAERDSCCGESVGSVAAGSRSVRIGGKAAARVGDALAAHSGTGSITAGSETVRIGG